jgi:hypothetical protein
MAKLSSKERSEIPSKEFAGPDRSYPIEDKVHAVNAKARAAQMLAKGYLSQSAHDRIIAKANAKLGESG